MLYLSAFFGRTVSNVALDKHPTIKFSEYSMEFLTRLESSNDHLLNFVGSKFLYIQKHHELIHFHFSSDLYFSVRVDPSSDTPFQHLKLKNKEMEVVIRLNDQKAFEGV